MRYLLRRIVVLVVSRCSSNRLALVGKQEAAFVRACSPGERRSERMLHEKRRLAFTIYSGFILAVTVGCASHTNSDVNVSHRPLPSRPPGRTSPLMRVEPSPNTAGAGAETMPSALRTQVSASTEALTVPAQSAPQPWSVAQSASPPSSQTSPAPGLGGTPPPEQPPAVLPPPAPGFPERLPPSPLMSPDLPVMTLDQLI